MGAGERQLRNQLGGREASLQKDITQQIIHKVGNSQKETRVDFSKLPLPKHSQWTEKFMKPLQITITAGGEQCGP